MERGWSDLGDRDTVKGKNGNLGRRRRQMWNVRCTTCMPLGPLTHVTLFRILYDCRYFAFPISRESGFDCFPSVTLWFTIAQDQDQDQDPTAELGTAGHPPCETKNSSPRHDPRSARDEKGNGATYFGGVISLGQRGKGRQQPQDDGL